MPDVKSYDEEGAEVDVMRAEGPWWDAEANVVEKAGHVSRTPHGWMMRGWPWHIGMTDTCSLKCAILLSKRRQKLQAQSKSFYDRSSGCFIRDKN